MRESCSAAAAHSPLAAFQHVSLPRLTPACALAALCVPEPHLPGPRVMSGWLAALKVDTPSVPVASAPQVEVGKTKVVVDANAIVKGLRLERLAEEAVTIPEVLKEIKDRQARHTLATLPFELHVRDPDAESIQAVRRFARLTGDLGALSDPDIRCIALHYMLEREAHGLSAVRTEPPPLVLSKHKHSKGNKQPGWDYVEDESEWAELDAMNLEAERNTAEVEKRMASATFEPEPEKPQKLPPTAILALEMKERLEKKRLKEKKTKELLAGVGDDGHEKENENENEDSEESEDDDDGWSQNVSRTTRIRRAKRAAQKAEEQERVATESLEKEASTSASEQLVAGAEKTSNEETDAVEKDRYEKSQQDQDTSAAFFRGDLKGEGLPDEHDETGESSGSESESESDTEPVESTITSATADYAMQNVLLQMNLKLVTPDGMRISELKRWVLRCHACGTISKETTRVFCSKCGNATLQKVQHTVSPDGAEQFGVRRKHKIRGTRFSVPAPKGGRKEKAPILREDQLIGMRKVKNKDDTDVFAAEYNEESFAGSSRGNQPGTAHLYHQRDLMEQGGFPKKNPNERRFVRTNRRRK